MSNKFESLTPPYPIMVSKERMQMTLPLGGGIEVFDTSAALEINKARLGHLESLKLPIEGKRVF